MDSIRNSIAAFPPEARQDDEESLAKVTRLAKIAQDLQHQVEELQAGQMPSTPPKVLEERRRASSEAAEKFREGEAICAKAIDVVAYQETKQQRKEKLCKALLKEKRNNYMGASPFLLKKNRKY